MKTVWYQVLFLFVAAGVALSTTHVIGASGFTFSPDTLTVAIGDTVDFSLALMHNAAEVSFATWQANDTTRNGGFWVPFGGGIVVLGDTGTHYFVCQAHASLGMKGIIRAIPTPPPTNSLTIRSIVDADGRLSTSGDRIARAWGMKLYKDSVGSGIVLASAASDTELTVDNLAAGTYVAVQADSPGWSHAGISVDGLLQTVPTPGQWTITLSSGDAHAITFFSSAPHTIINSGFTFLPDSILVGLGDTVRFVLELMHTAREVSESTWLADDTASNGGFNLPFGGGNAVLTQLGTHYFVCVPHAFLGMKGKIVVTSSVHRSIAAGWNMVSVPVRVFNQAPSAIFPSAISDAFSYDGSYGVATLLATGVGYWLKFSAADVASIDGFPIAHDTVGVSKGWNMIGTITTPLPVARINSEPPGIIASGIFGYDGAYVLADTLIPGFGYWVKTTAAGSLLLDSTSAGPLALPKPSDRIVSALATLEVRDATGVGQYLYLIDRHAENALARAIAEFPPPPPEGSFDVRFGAGGAIATLGDRSGGLFPITLSTRAYPVTLTWDIQSSGPSVHLRLGGSERELTGRGTLSIPGPGGPIALAVSGSRPVPFQYMLEQPYPNPFNPSTVIGYALPVESRVRLRVYNLLGQVIATLAEGVQPAGRNAVTWNAGGMASGLYFIRLDATPAGGAGQSFSAVSKVLLEK